MGIIQTAILCNFWLDDARDELSKAQDIFYKVFRVDKLKAAVG